MSEKLIYRFNRFDTIKRLGFEAILGTFFFIFMMMTFMIIASVMLGDMVIIWMIFCNALYLVAAFGFLLPRIIAIMFYSEYFKDVIIYEDRLVIEEDVYQWEDVVDIAACVLWPWGESVKVKGRVTSLFGGFLKVQDGALLSRRNDFWGGCFEMKIKMTEKKIHSLKLPNRFEIKSWWFQGRIFETNLIKHLKEIHAMHMKQKRV